MNIWDDKALLDRLEKKRDKLRATGKRLTFDCLNLKCKGKWVVCSQGHKFSIAEDGSVALLFILQGFTCSPCKECEDYNGGEV